MSDALVPTVKSLRVNTIQLSHPGNQVPVRGFDHQMVVVVHQAISVAEPIETRLNSLQDIKEHLIVGTLLIDRRARIAE